MAPSVQSINPIENIRFYIKHLVNDKDHEKKENLIQFKKFKERSDSYKVVTLIAFFFSLVIILSTFLFIPIVHYMGTIGFCLFVGPFFFFGSYAITKNFNNIFDTEQVSGNNILARFVINLAGVLILTWLFNDEIGSVFSILMFMVCGFISFLTKQRKKISLKDIKIEDAIVAIPMAFLYKCKHLLFHYLFLVVFISFFSLICSFAFFLLSTKHQKYFFLLQNNLFTEIINYINIVVLFFWGCASITWSFFLKPNSYHYIYFYIFILSFICCLFIKSYIFLKSRIPEPPSRDL